MQLPLPNFSEMTAEKFIMWGCAALLAFVLWGVDASLSAREKEHKQLLMIDQIICYNHAENNPVAAKRSVQQQRCLDFTLNVEK
jgi:hypothetical protein